VAYLEGGICQPRDTRSGRGFRGFGLEGGFGLETELQEAGSGQDSVAKHAGSGVGGWECELFGTKQGPVSTRVMAGGLGIVCWKCDYFGLGRDFHGGVAVTLKDRLGALFFLVFRKDVKPDWLGILDTLGREGTLNWKTLKWRTRFAITLLYTNSKTIIDHVVLDFPHRHTWPCYRYASRSES
jgi:hypothetical protein